MGGGVDGSPTFLEIEFLRWVAGFHLAISLSHFSIKGRFLDKGHFQIFTFLKFIPILEIHIWNHPPYKHVSQGTMRPTCSSIVGTSEWWSPTVGLTHFGVVTIICRCTHFILRFHPCSLFHCLNCLLPLSSYHHCKNVKG